MTAATAASAAQKRATASPEQLVINEIMAANVDEFISPAFNFDGWMELYNPAAQNIPLAGLYLSDDKENLTKWCIPESVGSLPSKGFRVIWFDSNDIEPKNAPFKLDVDGGTIYLSDTSGKLLMSQTYPKSIERISYARTTDGGDSWGLTAMASPGTSNNRSTFAEQQLSAPVVDQPSQLYEGVLTINVGIPPGCTLRYTTDCSLPTMDNGETSLTGQFTIDSKNANYRFRLYADGLLPSNVTTRSYIYRDRPYMLPVLSVVSDRRFLYDDSIGVMQKGRNGRPGNGQSTPCNWNMNWERPVNFSYIDPQNEMVLNQDVDLEMCGGWSRAWSPHSFKLKGTKEMGGNKNLPYPFFEQKPFIRNRTIQVRNGGNDTQCRFKDAALQYIIETSGVNIDCQSYQPVHEFINGRYIGVMNVREPNNKHYVYANYGWDDDEIDQFEMSPDSGYVQKCGTPDVFEELVDILSPDAANSETYSEICRVLDIDNYINYMAAEFYLGSNDWPQNNIKGFRLRDGGRFRFVLYDLDGTFGTSDAFNSFANKEFYYFDQLYPTSLGRKWDQIRLVTLFINLLQNEDFRRKFIDAYCIMGGSVLEASRSTTIINKLLERANTAMALNSGSATSTANSIRSSLSSRLKTATSALRRFRLMGLNNQNAQNVILKSDTYGAQLLINGTQVPTGQFQGNLFAPATLKAIAPSGYEFQGWLTTGDGKPIMTKGGSWDYYDQGSLDSKNWTAASYPAADWQKGNAPFGYGKDGIATTLDYGSDNNNKRPTVYFRTTVRLEQAPASTDNFTLNFTVDDGIIVYVNGTEAGRYNMPSGNVGYNTFASSYAPNNPDEASMTLDTKLFHRGNNVIAAELHNNSGNSTDLYWDAELMSTIGSDTHVYYSNEPEIQLPRGDNVILTASYRQLTSQERQTAGITPVRINEVSGANSIFINEYQKKNDWVELYNTTDEEVDVEGMYLTDDLSKPDKYQITRQGTNANTKIAPHGYMIVWCDKLETNAQGLHASFKISADGGVIALVAADRSWVDHLYYGPHDGNQTVGRFPDGAQTVYTTNVPTIAKANIATSYMEEVAQQPGGIVGVNTLMASDGDFRLRYGSQQLIVKSEDATTVQVEIYTTDGLLTEQTAVNLSAGKATLSVAHLPAGFYIARATDDKGRRVSCKFIITN